MNLIISAFTSLVRILKGIMSSEVELKLCVATAVTKYYKSIFKKKKKRERAYNIVSKTKLNTMEVLIAKALVGLSISHHTFFGKWYVERIQ